MEYKLLEKEGLKLMKEIAEDDDMQFDSRHAYFIYSVGMLPDCQDKGFGTKLLELVMFTKKLVVEMAT